MGRKRWHGKRGDLGFRGPGSGGKNKRKGKKIKRDENKIFSRV